MYLNIMNNKKTGKTTLSIRRGYRENGKVKHSTVENLGSLEDLKKLYDDPITHFKNVVKQMNEEEKNNNLPLNIKINKAEELSSDSILRKNFGYIALSKIYHCLEINKFLRNKFMNCKLSQNKINNILKMLVFGRSLYPDSKKGTYENKDIFFENSNFTLQDVYRALSYIEPHKHDLQKFIYNHIKEDFGNNTECVYYDVTNYYFEIDEPDELRKKGVSKEHRPNPIVQMGLFMDSLGLPMSYQLFSGNTNDCLTLRPMVQQLQKDYNIGKVIVVADKGLNTGNNIAYNVATGNGYVISQSIRGANAELKKFVLDETGYNKKGEDYKIKSRLYPREIIITKKDGTKIKQKIDEKQVIFYSKDYDKRAKAERLPALEKAKLLIGNPAKFNKSNSHGASKYVKHLVFDKETGEIIKAQSILSIDEDKLKEEEKYDGYYAIVTSEYEKTDEEILDIYRGLWRIEETFKVTKSELKARPVYVSRNEHIEAHFLTCYISLVLIRILQKKLDTKYSTGQILESLRNCCCSHLQENIYLFDYIDDVLNDIGKELNIDFTKKFMTLQEIKKISSNAKIK